jgi:hypothetical protein
MNFTKYFYVSPIIFPESYRQFLSDEVTWANEPPQHGVIISQHETSSQKDSASTNFADRLPHCL